MFKHSFLLLLLDRLLLWAHTLCSVSSSLLWLFFACIARSCQCVVCRSHSVSISFPLSSSPLFLYVVCVCVLLLLPYLFHRFFLSLALFNISMKIRTNYFQFELNTAIALRSMWCMRAFVYVRKLASVYTIRWLHSKSDWMVKFITFYAIESSRFAWCLCVCVCASHIRQPSVLHFYLFLFSLVFHIFVIFAPHNFFPRSTVAAIVVVSFVYLGYVPSTTKAKITCYTHRSENVCYTELTPKKKLQKILPYK